MFKAEWVRYTLKFKVPGGTSRGILTEKTSYFIRIRNNGLTGIGECGLLRGLSIDDRPGYEAQLELKCQNPDLDVSDWPSIQAGWEMALLDLGKKNILYPSGFTAGKKGIPINGLIWMGDRKNMRSQIIERIGDGFTCIKLKIGAIDFEEELTLLRFIRKEFNETDLEIRVDANGAFSAPDAANRLNQLSKYRLHSIEQPIRQGQIREMSELCRNTPVPIALDEELIGVHNPAELLDAIKPQYIILKPSLLGGFALSGKWIREAESRKIGWWVTSALESNVGLNAIAQWTATLNNEMPQGLGTGSLYTNNFESPLNICRGKLYYNPDTAWNINIFE